MSLNKKFSVHLLALLLLCAHVAPAQNTPQRERRTAPPAQTAAPTPPAQATPTPQPTPFVPAPRTLAELRTRLQEVIEQPQLAPAFLAAKVASLDTGRVLFETNAGKLMMPASNMKLYTVAAALDRLGPDFRFTTSVYAKEQPDKTGTVRGDLIIYGRGDPTYATRFNGGDYYKAIDDLAARVAAAGVKSVEGSIVTDESYFTGPPLGPGWEWDDLQWYYGAEVNALTVNDNALDIMIKPGANVGARGVVTSGPAMPGFIQILNGPISAMLPVNVINLTTTVARGLPRNIRINRRLDDNLFTVSGQIPEDDAGYSASVAVARPAGLFLYMFCVALKQHGVKLSKLPVRPSNNVNTSMLIEIARRESPPFSEVAAQTLKPSQNLYAELILRTLGKQFPASDPKLTTAEAGSAVVRAFLREAGVQPEHLSFFDGSGLARNDLITADATVQLLIYMNRHRHAQVWRDALPIAGVDGTLRNRLKNTPAANNLRAKTGTLNNVASLSGYVTSAAGEHLVFALIVNHYPEDADARRTYLDAVAVLLASFAGHS